jgi:histidinol dehydrogenase
MSNLSPYFILPEQATALAQRLAPRRSSLAIAELQQVLAVFHGVFQCGDRAVIAATRDYDGVALTQVAVDPTHVAAAVEQLPSELRDAIEVALRHIREVNEGLMPRDSERVPRLGTRVGERYRPLDSVAVYVPTRKGPLISTALMLIGAARVAGVRRIAMVAPPLASGSWEPRSFAAGMIAGATEFYVGNGVALIAALCQGTESVRRVDGIVGPGPAGVAAAMGIAGCLGKRTALGIGPTDCAILADETANPTNVALDLLAEAEHGRDSTSLLVTPCRELAGAVLSELERQIVGLPNARREVVEHVFGSAGQGALVVASWEAAIELLNDFAPEHLMLVGPRAESCLAQIRHVGEVLLGAYSPFSAANYAIGVTAVLPTNGVARSSSAVTARDFLRLSTTASLDAAALQTLAPTIVALAAAEGLPCHANAVTRRVVS